MIARGGMPFIVAPAVVIMAFTVAALLVSSNTPIVLSSPFAVILIIFLVFFRDPPRRIGRGLVSPADGKVIEADSDLRRVVVYMGILNVHVNRAPWSGAVLSQKTHPGGHSLAFSSEAADNYSVTWLIETQIGQMLLKQVAGLFARRIVPYVGTGASVKKGQRIGLIRFGSRVEVALPRTTRIVVKVGEKVRAGESTIAEVHNASAEC